jgi:hypothetical protein
LSIGIFDSILTAPNILQMIRIVYWFLVCDFLIFGIFDIWDWLRYKKDFDASRFRSRLPAFLSDPQKGQVRNVGKRVLFGIQFVLLAFFFAVIMALAGSIYPQRDYIFIVHSYLMAGGDSKFAFWSFFQYSVASVLPLTVVWVVILCVGSKAREKVKVISYYKGISSALYLSVGIGLGVFLLQ